MSLLKKLSHTIYECNFNALGLFPFPNWSSVSQLTFSIPDYVIHSQKNTYLYTQNNLNSPHSFFLIFSQLNKILKKTLLFYFLLFILLL